MTDLAALKAAHPIVDVLEQLGHQPPDRWNGRSPFTIRCPLPAHEDSTPSCRIDPGDDHFHCFGCGAHGDILDLVQRKLDLRTFAEVVTWIESGRSAVRSISPPAQPRWQVPAERVRECNRVAWEVLSAPTQVAVAVGYLRRRGIDTSELLRLDPVALGYTPARPDELTRELLGTGFTEVELIESGWSLDTDNGLRDRFRRRVLFPIRDEVGQLVGVTGRDVTGQASAKYLNTPTNAAYRKGDHLYRPIPAAPIEIVCEGPTDALAVVASGRAAAALCGTAMTAHQVELIAEQAARNVTLVPDGDQAGQRAGARWSRQLRNVGVAPRYLRLSETLDLADSLSL